MYCPKCGKENPDNAQLCRSCSSVLTSTPTQAPSPDAKTSGLAITSLVLAILSPFTCLITAIPAIILGIVSLVKIEKSAGQLKGKGLAIAGIAVTAASLLLGPLLLASVMTFTYRVHTVKSGIEGISEDEMVWVKCNNKSCSAEYQTGKRAYYKYVEEHGDIMAQTVAPLVCEKCGEHSVYLAEKCQNPNCGIVFFSGEVPNDFSDRCPKCGQSATEEIRKERMRERSGG